MKTEIDVKLKERNICRVRFNGAGLKWNQNYVVDLYITENKTVYAHVWPFAIRLRSLHDGCTNAL